MLKRSYRAAIITASDSAYAGVRVDESGAAIRSILEEEGYLVCDYCLLSDEKAEISGKLREWCGSGEIDLILTTGGTGLSPRDNVPEATLEVANRLVPGISEGIRAHSLAITKRAMLSRAVSVICENTLIINLPGSPKAVRESLEYALPVLEHALDVLKGNTGDCARHDND